jgi:DNA-3-methyladenine glycosylase II
LTKALMIDGQVLVFRVSSSGTIDAPQLDYTLHSHQPINEQTRRSAEDRISFFLSATEDLRPFYALAQQDAIFAPIAQRFHGLHQVKFLTPFEIACWAILTQRQPIPVAQKVKHHLTEQFGGSIEINGLLYRAFPEVKQLITVDYDALQAIVNNDRKTTYLLNLIHAFADIDEHWLRHAPVDDVEEWLRGIKGIGDWSSAFILIRGLGRMDYLKNGGPRLDQVVQRLYGKSATVEQIKANYGDYKGYWAYYLRTLGERNLA